MRQDFERSVLVAADEPSVWRTLLDISTVASWVTIVGAVREIAPLESYEAVLEDRLGPFRLRADLMIRITGREPGRSVTAEAEGEDRQVASRIAVTVRADTQPVQDGTQLTVRGTYEVTGRVAGLGAGSIRKQAARILDEFFAHAQSDLGAVSC